MDPVSDRIVRINSLEPICPNAIDNNTLTASADGMAVIGEGDPPGDGMNTGTISMPEKGFWDFVSEFSINYPELMLVYGSLDMIYVYWTNLVYGHEGAHHLNGEFASFGDQLVAVLSPFLLPLSSVNSSFEQSTNFSKFTNIDDLKHLFDGKTLNNVADDLIRSRWKQLEGNWGSRTVFEKIIGNKRFYVQWETNALHSTTSNPVSYWKITYGKISATSKNTIRISPYQNFKP